VCLPLEINPRHALRVSVVDLIPGWGHCGTNRRHAKGRASPITNQFETHFKVASRRFDFRLRLL
jgi:hypothetical protein